MNSKEARPHMACHIRLDKGTLKTSGARGGHSRPCVDEKDVRLNKKIKRRVPVSRFLDYDLVNLVAVLVDLAHREALAIYVEERE